MTVKDPKTGKKSVLHTTWHHPFWNATGKTWTDAKDPKPGDKLRSPDGETTETVAAVKVWTGLKWMDDLTVNDTHTYYVLAGTTPVLVHNCGSSTDLPDGFTPAPSMNEKPLGPVHGYDLRGGKDPMSIVPDDASVRELTPHSGNGSKYGLEFKWTNGNGNKVRMRIHGPDGTAPAGSNSASGETCRIQIGRGYQDEAGNVWHPNVHNEDSPFYNPDAANKRHIPWPEDHVGL